jgi:hypothetical protein
MPGRGTFGPPAFELKRDTPDDYGLRATVRQRYPELDRRHAQ